MADETIDLDGLEPAEREAIEAGDEFDDAEAEATEEKEVTVETEANEALAEVTKEEPKAEDEEVVDEKKEEDTEDPDEAEDEEVVAAKGDEEAPAPEDDPEDKDEAETEEDVEGPTFATPDFTVPDTGDDITIEKIGQAVTILKDQYKKAEIDEETYFDSREQLQGMETRLLIKNAQAESAERSNQAVADATWDAQQKVFFAQNPDYAQNRTLLAALDGHVKRIAITEEYKDLDGFQTLKLAKKIVDADLGRITKKEEVTPAAEEEVKPPPAKPKKKPPTTLASVPAAEENPTGDRFTKLDSLGGEALELALGNMSESDQNAYLMKE